MWQQSEQHNTTKTGCELMCSDRVSSSCPTSAIYSVTFVKYLKTNTIQGAVRNKHETYLNQ